MTESCPGPRACALGSNSSEGASAQACHPVHDAEVPVPVADDQERPPAKPGIQGGHELVRGAVVQPLRGLIQHVNRRPAKRNGDCGTTTPASTAFIVMKWLRVELAMTWARVVFPVPGGP